MKQISKKTIIYLVIGLFFLSTFFLKIIPVPVENIDGALDKDKFIYGGTYWTSGMYEVGVDNHQGMISYFGIFIVLVGGTHLIKK